MTNKFILILALLTGIQSASAQGTAFTYQGRLTASGNTANGRYDFIFDVFDAPSGGSTLAGSVNTNNVPVTNGLFTVGVDFGPTPFTGSARWLQIRVSTNDAGIYSTLAPRQLITSTPYAIRAANFSGPVAASQLTGTISSNNIGAGSITLVMLAAGAVGSNQLAAGAVTTGALADGAVTALKVAVVSNWFALTIANPTPAASDLFGYAVAGVGNDRVLIGAHQDSTGAPSAGAAYLFNANGTLLTTFTNPAPAPSDLFGYSVAAVGSDRVLIGADLYDTGGAAYLFSTDGTLLTTITNPTPAAGDVFGRSVAAVGSERVLIGAYLDDTGAINAGAAYLFRTDGTLLTTFTNPTPAFEEWFGYSVAAVGSDRVLIGALFDNTGATEAGAAYLFSTNGTLLTTFTNPSPANFDLFGRSVAALGSDRVLISADLDDTGANDAGAAYLFRTDGTLLTTFTNPTPASSDFFGASVAALGSDRVLIGASLDDTGAINAGAAYLFSTNGTLLTTFTNPKPANSDLFGSSVAAVGANRVLIGAQLEDTGAPEAGAAYLFSIEAYAPGLIADGVRARSVITPSLEDEAVTVAKLADGAVTTDKLADGAVTPAKLHPALGLWTREGENVYRHSGNVGIGTTFPLDPLEVVADVRRVGLNTAVPGVDAGGIASFSNPSSGSKALLVGVTASPNEDCVVFGSGVGTEMRLVSGGLSSAGFGFYLNMASSNAFMSARPAPAVKIAGSGNVGIGTNTPGQKLHVVGNILATGTITPNSDRNAKTQIEPVDCAAILDRVATLPIKQWRFKTEDPDVRHVGPMAQDFHAAFKLGSHETAIATVDADGVALAAIQGLNRKLEEQRIELQQKQTEITELKERLETLEGIIRNLKPN